MSGRQEGARRVRPSPFVIVVTPDSTEVVKGAVTRPLALGSLSKVLAGLSVHAAWRALRPGSPLPDPQGMDHVRSDRQGSGTRFVYATSGFARGLVAAEAELGLDVETMFADHLAPLVGGDGTGIDWRPLGLASGPIPHEAAWASRTDVWSVLPVLQALVSERWPEVFGPTLWDVVHPFTSRLFRHTIVDGMSVYGHGGRMPATKSFLLLSPDQGVGVLAGDHPLGRDIVALAWEHLRTRAETRRGPVSASASSWLRRYCTDVPPGRYRAWPAMGSPSEVLSASIHGLHLDVTRARGGDLHVRSRAGRFPFAPGATEQIEAGLHGARAPYLRAIAFRAEGDDRYMWVSAPVTRYLLRER